MIRFLQEESSQVQCTVQFLYPLSTCNGTLDVEWRTNFNRHVPAEELRSRCKCLASPAVRYSNQN